MFESRVTHDLFKLGNTELSFLQRRYFKQNLQNIVLKN